MNDITIPWGQGHLGVCIYGDAASSKPWVLAVHGWLDNAATFNQLAPLLDEYTVVCLDFPGHGHSSHLQDDYAYYNFVQYISSMQAVIAHQGCVPAFVLGHSLGGIVSLMLSVVAPDLVPAVVCLDSWGPYSLPAAQTAVSLRRFWQKHDQLNRQSRVYPSLEDMLEAKAAASQLSESEVEPLVKRQSYAVPEGYTWRYDERLKLLSPWVMTEPQVLDCLSAVACPCCLVQAEQGLVLAFPDKKVMEQRQEVAKLLTVKSVPTGHYAHITSKDHVAQVIREWLVGL